MTAMPASPANNAAAKYIVYILSVDTIKLVHKHAVAGAFTLRCTVERSLSQVSRLVQLGCRRARRTARHLSSPCAVACWLLSCRSDTQAVHQCVWICRSPCAFAWFAKGSAPACGTCSQLRGWHLQHTEPAKLVVAMMRYSYFVQCEP
jgi:hypothetical protein